MFRVTNPHISGETRIPITDVTEADPIPIYQKSDIKAIAKRLNGKSFQIIGSKGIAYFPNTNRPLYHFVRSSSPARYEEPRLKILSDDQFLTSVLSNAVYVERAAATGNHTPGTHFIDCYAAVKDDETIYCFKIVATDTVLGPGHFVIKSAEYYDIFTPKEGSVVKRKETPPTAANGYTVGRSASFDTISLAELLHDVKGRDGEPLVNADGTLNYDTDLVFSMLGQQGESIFHLSDEELTQQVLTAYPTAKNIQTTEHGVTFTMPNGMQITHNVVSQHSANPKVWEKMNAGKLFDFMEAPAVLQMLGILVDERIQAFGSFFQHAEDASHLGMDDTVLRNLPKAMANPTMIIKGNVVNYVNTNTGKKANARDSYVFLLSVKNENGVPIVVAVHLDSEVKHGKKKFFVDVIKTAFGKDKGRKGLRTDYQWFLDQAAQKNILYINRKKVMLGCRP